MSATFRDPAMITGDRTPEKITPTTDLESTTDLHGDSTTTDLSPPTTDVASSAIVGTPSLERVDASEPVATPHHGVATQQIAPGTVLCDRYILERVVGTGGTAVVYQACDMTSSTGTALNTRVA
jgi:hypothetical protein